MRLVADHDRRMAEAMDAWRAERRDLDEALRVARAETQAAVDARDEAIAQTRDAEKRTHNAALKVCCPAGCSRCPLECLEHVWCCKV